MSKTSCNKREEEKKRVPLDTRWMQDEGALLDFRQNVASVVCVWDCRAVSCSTASLWSFFIFFSLGAVGDMWCGTRSSKWRDWCQSANGATASACSTSPSVYIFFFFTSTYVDVECWCSMLWVPPVTVIIIIRWILSLPSNTFAWCFYCFIEWWPIMRVRHRNATHGGER